MLVRFLFHTVHTHIFAVSFRAVGRPRIARRIRPRRAVDMRASRARVNVAPARRVSTRARATDASTSSFTLADGVPLERVIRAPARATKSPLVFVHGSYHAAWCYEEHFAAYFAARGRATVSVSLRGHGKSGATAGARVAGTLASHAADVAEALERGLGDARASGRKAVLVGHSFGGLVAQRVASDERVALGGVALLASVPPTGNGAMVRRFLRRDLWASAKITWAFITKAFGKNPALCRECFFSPELPEADVERFARAIDASSSLRMLDLRALDAELPVPRARGSTNRDIPVLVLGGDRDFVVDREGLEETARWFEPRATLAVVPGVAHDVMLDAGWERVARELDRWLDEHDL